MLDPERALGAALLACLRADPAVAGLLAGRLYDAPPIQPTYPYLTVGRSQSRPWGGLDGEGIEHSLTLTVASRFDGLEECRAIAGAVRTALDGAALTLTDHRLVNLRIVFTDVFRAADWRNAYAALRLRAVTEPLS